jgi:hypothetical protein
MTATFNGSLIVKEVVWQAIVVAIQINLISVISRS